MKRKIRTYEANEIVVEYDVARCIHVKECVHRLPAVFNTERRAWVAPDRAPAESVAEVVRRCPTGALHYRIRAGTQEEPDLQNTVHIAADGPLYLRGRLRIRMPGGETVEETRVALCRCGVSHDKPFCDNSHVAADFADPATNVSQRLGTGEAATSSAPVEVTFESNGSILIEGPVTVRGADGSEAEGVRGSLCRCGQSATKPFCDGSHFASGFEAD